MKDAFIGIDLGTSSVKISLVDVSRTLLNTTTRTYGLNIGKDGMAEQNPQEWVDAVLDGLGGATSKVRVVPGRG